MSVFAGFAYALIATGVEEMEKGTVIFFPHSSLHPLFDSKVFFRGR